MLAQAILGALGYLAPMALASGSQARASVRDVLERFGPARLLVHNVAAVALLLGVAGRHLLGADLAALTAWGLALLAVSVLGHLALGVRAWAAAHAG